LPYYKIEKTQKGKDFFHLHMGYFNFWDTYLILKKDDVIGVYTVLVNRGNYKFHGKMTDKQKESMVSSITTSIYFRKPEEMFNDFPEMKEFDYLEKYSIYSLVE